ncbi:MAG TPA: T9SS type A sorting domain-containing protein [Catalimonadaceae bacterium]|nr:T9SS type A sorting domain-containing protein [Catalimonadaceae bacterium]
MRFSLLSLIFLFFVCLTAVSQSFSPQILSTYSPSKPTISWVDVDVDGKKDMVLAYSNSGRFSWIRNLGNSYFGPAIPIQIPDTVNLAHGCFADMDQDGKMDIVSVRITDEFPIWVFPFIRNGTELVWQKNLGSGLFGSVQHLCTIEAGSNRTFLNRVVAKDLNEDGKPDFIVATTSPGAPCIIPYFYAFVYSTGSIYELLPDAMTYYSDNTYEGSIEPFKQGPGNDWFYLRISDSNFNNGVFYQSSTQFENLLVQAQSLILGTGVSYSYETKGQIGDLTGDTSVEILCSIKTSYSNPAYKLGFYTHPGLPNAEYHLIDSGAGIISSFQIVDFDKDGRADIVASKENNIIWYQNVGQGLFAAPLVLYEFNTSFASISVTDADMDSDPDIVGYSETEDKLYYFENGGYPKLCVSGKIYFDKDLDCHNNQYFILPNLSILKFSPGDYLTATMGKNAFYQYLPAGNYTTQLVTKTPGIVADTICGDPSLEFSLDSTHSFHNVDVGIQGSGCAQLGLIGSASPRVPCRKTSTNITFINQGFGPADQVVVRLTLPPTAIFREYSSNYYPTHTFDSQTGEHVFSINSVAGLSNGYISIVDSNQCVFSTTGNFNCTLAKVQYGGKCLPNAPNWDHSDMAVTGECDGNGAAVFQIRNNGTGTMADSNTYRIYTAAGITNTGKFKLLAGESMWISVPSANKVFHLAADQSPNHPFGGFATGTILPCFQPATMPAPGENFVYTGTNSDIEQLSICARVLGSMDPNDKQVYPEGWGIQGNVQSQTRFQYRIRFQNTGTAEAHYVQIRDTLSEHLDITTLTGIDGSFPYNRRFELSGTLEKPILIFIFENIVLPDSNTNKAGSEGFVTFSIAAKPGLSQQTQIRNEATIYFDINPGVRTNTVINTINDSIPHTNPVILAVSRPLIQTDFQVVPNPTSGQSKVLFSRPVSGRLQVFDLQGKCWMYSQLSGSQTEPLLIPSVKKGLFVVRFLSEDGAQSQQKLVVE